MVQGSLKMKKKDTSHSVRKNQPKKSTTKFEAPRVLPRKLHKIVGIDKIEQSLCGVIATTNQKMRVVGKDGKKQQAQQQQPATPAPQN